MRCIAYRELPAPPSFPSRIEFPPGKRILSGARDPLGCFYFLFCCSAVGRSGRKNAPCAEGAEKISWPLLYQPHVCIERGSERLFRALLHFPQIWHFQTPFSVCESIFRLLVSLFSKRLEKNPINVRVYDFVSVFLRARETEAPVKKKEGSPRSRAQREYINNPPRMERTRTSQIILYVHGNFQKW